MTNAIHRTPCLETAKIKMLLNGPESFTPDGNFILGEAPELRNYFVCAGFNSAGIANSGGAGRLIAEWIVGGEAPSDLWDVDIRRFGAVHREPQGARRAHRRDARPALRDALAAPGARDRAAAAHVAALRPARRQRRGLRQQERLGARELLPPAAGATPRSPRARPARLAAVDARASSARRARRSRCTTRPRSASCCCRAAMRSRVLQRLCANEIDVPVGRMVYTAMLNERGGFESDLTVIAPGRRPLPDRHRLGADARATSTGSRATSSRREHAALTDVSAMTSVLSVMGPNARALLGRASAPTTSSPRSAEVLAHARDRPRPRARARRAHELRRRTGLRAVRADRDGAPRVPGAARRARRRGSGCAMPATTRSMRCASRPAGAPGAPSSAPTRRRSRPD